MNLFFRFLRIIISAMLARPATGLLDTHVIGSSVWIGDQDPMGHMTNSRYSSFTDLAIMNYMGRTGALRAFRRHGWLPVIQYEALSYFRMLRYPQSFEVRTRLVGWEDTQMVFEHLFMRGDCLHARSLMVARLTGRKKTRITAAMALEVLGTTLPSPELQPEIRNVIDQLRAERP